MSKRHQNSRRKSYGRRQHELRERSDRRPDTDRIELAWDDGAERSTPDAFAFGDRSLTPLRFALGD